MTFPIILPSAWELTEENISCELFALYVPIAWQQVAQSLAQIRAKRQGKGFRGVPVYSLDPLIAGSFPPIIQTVRKGWQKPGVPWLFASEPTDNISYLASFVKDWLKEEFSNALEDSEINSHLENLADSDWQWEILKNYSLLSQPKSEADIDIRFQAIPDYLARKFLQNPRVSFGTDAQYQLKFYRVVRLKGAELMSWPPHSVPLFNSKKEPTENNAEISLVIRFLLQTVPWREKPIIYPQLSIRRWIAQPLDRLPYRGATVYIGDRYRWLDGKLQPYCFIPLPLKRYNKEAKWPPAISELLLMNDSPLPAPNTLIANPTNNWSLPNAELSNLETAIAYDNRHLGQFPCFPGVSSLDLAALDRAISERLPLQRVGSASRLGNLKKFWPVKSQPKNEGQSKNKEPKDINDLHTPMLRSYLAAPATFRLTEHSLQTISILWETSRCRDELIAEICQLLGLSPTDEEKTYKTRGGGEGKEQIYKGCYGSLRILIQHVGDLTQNLDVGDFSVPAKTRQQRRIELLEKRIQTIQSFLPPTEGLSGALIEIKPKPTIRESDPKLAWRIGAMRAGYVNQHIHRITYLTKQGEEKLNKAGLEPVKRAVSDLLRQCGILPVPLIKKEIDGIDPHVWLTCFWVLRRTKKTTATNLPNTVVLMLRVNPLTGKVEITTPSLFPKWIFYPFAFPHLLNEKWNPDAYADEWAEESDEREQRREIEREQNLINGFVARCLRDCLNTPIAENKSHQVLFMAEAQNARLKL